MKALLIAVLMLLMLVSAPAGAAEPWGNDPSHNMVMQAQNVPATLDEAHEAWTVETNTRWQFPMPTIIGDRVLIGSARGSVVDESWSKALKGGGVLTCRALEDGALLWQLVVAKRGYGLSTYGVTTTPVIEGDRIYILVMDEMLCVDLDGLADGNDGYQDELALMKDEGDKGYELPEGAEPHTELPDWSGDIIWRHSLGQYPISYQDATACSPVMLGDQIWISTSHQLGSQARRWRGNKPKYAPHMIVLDKNDGSLIARDEMDIPIVYHGEWSSPSLVNVDGTPVIVFPDGYGMLRGLAVPEPSEDGAPVVLEELWSYDLNLPEWRERDGKLLPYTEDKRLFFKYPPDYPDGDRWFKYEEDGRAPYRYNGPSETIGRPTVVGNRIYLGVGRDCYYNSRRKPEDSPEVERGKKFWGPGRFMCLELESPDEPPRLVWEDRQVKRTQCTASIVDGLVYVGDTCGFLHCLDADTGEAYWREDLGHLVECAAQMVVDGKIYVPTADNELFVYRAGRETEQLFKRRFRSWISTVYPADGMLLISTLRKVTLFRSEPEE